MSRWVAAVAAVVVLATLTATSGVSHGQAEGEGAVVIPMFSWDINDHGVQLGPTADGGLVFGLVLTGGLDGDPSQVGVLYVYVIDDPETCNGAKWALYVGFDPQGRPVAAIERLRNCTQDGRELIDEPTVHTYQLPDGSWKIAIEVPAEVGTVDEPVAASGTTCSEPLGGCVDGTAGFWDLAREWAAALLCDGEQADVVGTEANDDLQGTPQPNIIVAFDGDDTADGLGGDDLICLGPGDDTGRGGPGHDTVLGDAGDDRIFGGIGDDDLSGDDGDDTMLGGDGRDLLLGGEGGDTLKGGDHRDRLEGDAGIDSLDGGAGNDFLLGGSEGDQLQGGPGEDRLRGGDGDDVLSGGDDADKLFGGEGNDTLRGQAGNDGLRGGPGTDRLKGGADDDSLAGGAGDDVLNGGGSNDVLNGGVGDDVLRGGPAGDVLAGGPGTSDECIGGGGVDALRLPNHGCETVSTVP